jgi:hypothetical protein
MTNPVHSSGRVGIWCIFRHRSKARKESPYEGFVIRLPNWSAIDSVHVLGGNFRNNSRHCPLLHNLKPWEEEKRQWKFFQPSIYIFLMFTLRVRVCDFLFLNIRVRSGYSTHHISYSRVKSRYLYPLKFSLY